MSLGPDTTITQTLFLDFAKAIVGDTTSESALLWFALHGIIRAGDTYFCDIEPVTRQASSIPAIRLPIEFNPVDPGNPTNPERVALVPVSGLQPATQYRYALRLHTGAGSGDRTMASGTFTTEAASSAAVRFVFSSCHSPADKESLHSWKELAARRDYDFMLLVGDQIYGDEIAHLGRSWFERYASYHQFWNFWPVREFFGAHRCI
jgi:phosphodiesterase/alkaline phosphatase D-like protein